MYPQGVCRIRKPACAGNGCAIFLVFQTEEVGQKRRLRLADAIVRCCLRVYLKTGNMTNSEGFFAC